MTATTQTAARLAANLRQIDALRVRRDEIVSECLKASLGGDECQDRCDAISEQIVALYEEIDALESGETAQHVFPVYADEVAVTPAELAAVAHLGWGRVEIIKAKKKAISRR